MYHHIQSCIVAVLVETATKLLNFATKLGLAWWNVVMFDKKSVSDSPPITTCLIMDLKKDLQTSDVSCRDLSDGGLGSLVTISVCSKIVF